MKKNLLLITIAILALVFAGLSVYVFVLREEPKPPLFSDTLPSPEELLVSESTADPDAPLAQLSARPIAGFTATDAGEIVVVTGGGVVQVLDGTGVVLEERPLSLSPVVSARVSPDGQQVAFEVINTNTLEGRWYIWDRDEPTAAPRALPATARDIRFAPAGSLLRIEDVDDRISTRLVLDAGGRETVLATSAIPDLQARWIDDERLLITNAPSGIAPGTAYTLNTRTRAFSRLMEGRAGLSAYYFDNTLLFTETLSTSRLRTGVLVGEDERYLPVTTLPERCTPLTENELLCSTLYSQTGARLMPDDYYKGVVTNQRSDLVRISSTATAVSLARVPIDGIHPQFSHDGRYVFLINKNDGALWRVRLGSGL